DGHVLEHVGGALESHEVVVFIDAIEGLRMILELIGAEPARRMIERIDCGARADRPEGADGCARNEATLVHAKIFAHDHIGADLRILVQEQWTANGGLDDPGAGVEPYDAMKERRLEAGILEEINRNVGKLHVGLGASRPTENFDPNLAAFPLDGTVGTKLSIPSACSNVPARTRSCSMRRGGLRDVDFGRTLVIAMDDLVNRSYCNQAALFQENCPVAHRFDQRIGVTGKYKDAGALDQRLHAGLGARRKSCIPGAQPFVEQ